MPRDQIVLFTTSLEERIPDDHPVRLLDEILDQLDWSDWEAEYHGALGQPPIHPSVLAKTLLFALIRRIRSSRQIEYNIQHSIDFMWLVSGRTIDHVTLSEFRRKHQKQLKKIYRRMVQLAIDLKVAKLAELCIDGTRVLANANRYKTWTAERLQKALGELDGQIAKALQEMESADQMDELFDDGQAADQLPAPLGDLKTRQRQLRELLQQVEQMDSDRRANGIDPQKNPAQLPKTDTDARILPNKEGGYAANYTPMIVTETAHGFIVDADMVIGNVEHPCMLTMVDTIQCEYHEPVETMMGDTAYSAGENLTGMEERDIELLAPLADVKCPDNPAHREDLTQPVAESEVDRLPINPQTKRFDKTAFVYDEEHDCYYCPASQVLPRSGQEKKKRGGKTTFQLIYTCYDCADCPLAALCRVNPQAKKGRRITHDMHEAARRRHRERMKIPENKERYKRRQHYGETPFAVIKAALDLRRFLLRGLTGVQTEWLWMCTAFNLKKLMSLWHTVRELCPETENRP
jgi:transposase